MQWHGNGFVAYPRKFLHRHVMTEKNVKKVDNRNQIPKKCNDFIKKRQTFNYTYPPPLSKTPFDCPLPWTTIKTSLSSWILHCWTYFSATIAFIITCTTYPNANSKEYLTKCPTFLDKIVSTPPETVIIVPAPLEDSMK